MTLAEDLLIDIKVDFSRDEIHPDLGAQRCSLRPSFPPCQAEADACTRALDKGIRDTHLQRGLKDHSSTQVRKGEVCCISSFVIKIPVMSMF